MPGSFDSNVSVLRPEELRFITTLLASIGRSTA
jgi:hypothetical protein